MREDEIKEIRQIISNIQTDIFDEDFDPELQWGFLEDVLCLLDDLEEKLSD